MSCLPIPHPLKTFFLFAFVLSSFLLHGQRIFEVKYSSQADLKIFVVEYESQCDLKVFFVKYESQAKEDGLWYNVSYESQTDKTIFFVDYESQADLKIFYVQYESQAGWRNLEKKHLLGNN